MSTSLVAITLGSALPGSDARAAEPDPFAAVSALIRVFFPELRRPDLYLRLSAARAVQRPWSVLEFVREFTFQVAASSDLADTPRQAGETEQLLVGVANFEDYGELRSTYIHGRVNHFEQWTNLCELIGGHPEWTDAQVAAAMKQAGVKYGSGDDKRFRATLPSARDLREVLGGVAQIDEIRFDTRAETGLANVTRGVATWTVSIKVATAARPDGVTYYAMFEPFDGKLRALGRSSLEDLQ